MSGFSYDEDEFASAMSPRSPRRLRKIVTEVSKKMVRSFSKHASKRTETVEIFDEDEDVLPMYRDSSATCGDDYIESSDCLLLDGLVDTYLSGQKSRRRGRMDYNVRYFHAAEEAAEWPLSMESSTSTMCSYRSMKSNLSVSTSASTSSATSTCTTSSVSTTSTRMSL